MVSLPGDSASSERVVNTPYATASNAHITATSAPWSDRKLDKGTPLESDKKGSPCGPPWSAGSLPRGPAYCPGTHKRPDDWAGPVPPSDGFSCSGSAPWFPDSWTYAICRRDSASLTGPSSSP